MLFPVYLVGLFFATLHLNPTALYSPSDYKDENNFVNSVRKATPEELRMKLHQEVKEVEDEIKEDRPGPEPDATPERQPEPKPETPTDAPENRRARATERSHCITHVEHVVP